SAFEYFRSRGKSTPQEFVLPNVPVFNQFTAANSLARSLLEQYAPPEVSGPGLTGAVTLTPPVSVNRILAIERLDFSPSSNDRIMGSLLLSRVERPDFIWTPYEDFVS